MAVTAYLQGRIETDDRGIVDGQFDEAAAAAIGALNRLDLAVAVIGADGRIVIANPRFRQLFGDDRDAEITDWIGDDHPDRAGPRDIARRDGRTFRIETARLPQGLLVTAADVTAQAAELARTAERARSDPLTLLGNRATFRDRLTALAAGDPATRTAAVLSIDLDRFKAINDSLGTAVGDALLRVVADRIRSGIRSCDIAARFGGDEFGIVQIGQPQPQSAAALAKRLVDLLGRSYIVDGHLLNIGASVGIALMPADGTDCDQILRNADLALGRAKQEGRGTYRFFEIAMDEHMRARRSLELELRRALALRELALVYQPQFNLGAKRVTGFEALLRWHNPKRGLVSPADFIPLAEETGLIVPIGEWVLRTACQEAAGWHQPLSVAVNVSAVQFRSPNLVSTILAAVADSGLDPRRLELEITESALLGDHAAAREVLHKVRALGVRVAMDDFGTGYSSLSQLRSFPFNTIKIDQSFVRSAPDDPGGPAIVRAIATMGRSLGMTTVAEGVETAEQLARVAADGCTDVQGYLISRPLASERIAAFLLAQMARAAPEADSTAAPNGKA